MATESKEAKSSQDVLWHSVLEALGCRNVNQLIQTIMVSDGVPNGDVTDYRLVYDRTNSDVYWHSTGATYTKLNA